MHDTLFIPAFYHHVLVELTKLFPKETRVIFETQLGQSLVAVAKFLLPAKTTV